MSEVLSFLYCFTNSIQYDTLQLAIVHWCVQEGQTGERDRQGIADSQRRQHSGGTQNSPYAALSGTLLDFLYHLMQFKLFEALLLSHF